MEMLQQGASFFTLQEFILKIPSCCRQQDTDQVNQSTIRNYLYWDLRTMEVSNKAKHTMHEPNAVSADLASSQPHLTSPQLLLSPSCPSSSPSQAYDISCSTLQPRSSRHLCCSFGVTQTMPFLATQPSTMPFSAWPTI